MGIDHFKNLSFRKLPTLLRTICQLGWYEGCGFYTIMGTLSSVSSKFFPPYLADRVRVRIYLKSGPVLTIRSSTNNSLGIMNYRWSQTGIYDIYDKGIVGVYLGLLVSAVTSLYKGGDKPAAVALSSVVVMQGLALRNSSYSKLLK